MVAPEDDECLNVVHDVLNKQMEILLDDANEIIAEYWIWAKDMNQTLQKRKKMVQKGGAATKEEAGAVNESAYNYVGPRIEKIQSGSGENKRIKHQLIWSYYAKTPLRMKEGVSKANGIHYAKMGKRIRMTSNKEYDLDTLCRFSVGWDAKKILETEKQLTPIREKMEGVHKATVELRKTAKRLNRIVKKQEDFFQDESNSNLK